MEVGVVVRYDPDVFKLTGEDFSRVEEDRSFAMFLFPRLIRDGAVEKVFLFGDYAGNVTPERDGLRFRGWPAEERGPGLFVVDPAALGDEDVVKRLGWAGQIGELWVLYQVAVDHPTLRSLLSSWVAATTPQQEEILRAGKLQDLLLDPGQWRALAGLVEGFPPGRVAVSFAGEGLALCVFGREDELAKLRGRPA